MLFWNWVNQSQNALVNYFNRNAASNMSNETMAMSYAGAVGSALTIAFGLSTVNYCDSAHISCLLTRIFSVNCQLCICSTVQNLHLPQSGLQ